MIFICDHDPFGAKKYRYTWDMICREEPALELYDGSHTIILSTCGENDEEVPEELVKFLKFVGAGLEESTDDYADDYIRRLQSSVVNIKTSREMEARYMLWEELVKEEREDAKAEGRAEERIEMILELLSELAGELPADLKECIQKESDMEILKEYFRKARKASSIEEFEEWLNSGERA